VDASPGQSAVDGQLAAVISEIIVATLKRRNAETLTVGVYPERPSERDSPQHLIPPSHTRRSQQAYVAPSLPLPSR
jgi:hypothetical protein